MDMSGEYRIAAPIQTVWDAIQDPEILRGAIPGCEELEKTGETEMSAKVSLKIGPVKAKFAGEVALKDLVAPNSLKIEGEGKGGIAGFAKGGADVQLAEDGNETILTYQAEAQVGGKIAQLGSRLIQSTAAKLADKFFANLRDELEES
ncbi:CoxG family protein [Neptunicoccus cionae]|uniref:CoxG family protein n=1 Tax=Neptunicoccus cionae TaxID=2035344 RepID=UPI000C7692E2|nr:carbon monoxide dehydrogenase subunit G [Amylibacter cionae]PLS20652.1 carbon monoxide dehydrogenase [Amylibacter cionae]